MTSRTNTPEDIKKIQKKWLPKKEWVGLTDEEIHKIEQECDQKFEDYFEFANAIEAKLKEKNT
jgi:hypothetical protein